MRYSLRQLFQLIDQHKSPNEFYGECSGCFGMNYYINRVTSFHPEANRILCGFGDERPLRGLEIEQETIWVEEREVILFLYNSHNEDFMLERQKSMDDVFAFMYGASGIQNEFWGDIGVIDRNQRKKCYVRTPAGKLITRDAFFAKNIAGTELAYQIELL